MENINIPISVFDIPMIVTAALYMTSRTSFLTNFLIIVAGVAGSALIVAVILHILMLATSYGLLAVAGTILVLALALLAMISI